MLRGMADSDFGRWTLGMIHAQNICNKIEAYCELDFEVSYVDANSSRIDRNSNAQKQIVILFVSFSSIPRT